MNEYFQTGASVKKALNESRYTVAITGAGLHEENLKKAQDWISKAELILTIGANGSYGNAYFNYRKRGAKIIQINPGETNFDSYASINIRAGADEVFRLIV
ncbi:MAG: hypothetical protein LUD01_06430 [Clostridiales bacterium]|nr:hypothetical protein [Clostridiales bacterium]